MDVLPNTIYAREAFLPMSLPAKDLLINYVPFVVVTDATWRDRNVSPVTTLNEWIRPSRACTVKPRFYGKAAFCFPRGVLVNRFIVTGRAAGELALDSRKGTIGDACRGLSLSIWTRSVGASHCRLAPIASDSGFGRGTRSLPWIVVTASQILGSMFCKMKRTDMSAKPTKHPPRYGAPTPSRSLMYGFSVKGRIVARTICRRTVDRLKPYRREEFGKKRDPSSPGLSGRNVCGLEGSSAGSRRQPSKRSNSLATTS
jgi:hypothetical protein